MVDTGHEECVGGWGLWETQALGHLLTHRRASDLSEDIEDAKVSEWRGGIITMFGISRRDRGEMGRLFRNYYRSTGSAGSAYRWQGRKEVHKGTMGGSS